MPYYEVVIDPENLMNTFDNSFSISFLFRDTRIGFTKGDDGEPAIFPVTKDYKTPLTENKQFIATLDMELIEVCV